MREAARDTLWIGELAAACGLTPKTIRYYEALGLLPPPQRSAAGYRLYRTADRERLRFITQAKALGLTLEEIREILALRQQGQSPCARVLALLDRKLAELDAQLRLLADLRQELAALRERAAATATTEAPVCGIIEHHAPERAAAPQGLASRAARRPRR
ncbi:MAG TPA: heavy metal-responsive transcriptional regulator [Chloroflexota bacterium]|nr:heavy metal-responsive transcriptional regulator [Chloroflexota bacterium]